MNDLDKLDYLINQCFWADGLGGSDVDLKEYIKKNYLPKSTLIEVIEGMKLPQSKNDEDMENEVFIRNQALLDLLKAIESIK